MKRPNVSKASWQFALSLMIGQMAVGSAVGAVLFEERFENYLTTADAEAAGWESRRLNTLDFSDSLITLTGVDESGTDWTLDSTRFRDAPIGPNGLRTSAIGDVTKSPGQNTDVFTGYFMSNSDEAGGNDSGNLERGYVLTSPSFDASGASSVYLTFSTVALLNDGGDDSIFEVYTSADGVNWTLVERRVPHDRQASPSNAGESWTIDEVGGIRGTVTYNVTSELAGESNAYVRFVNRAPGDSWLISIDDVLVTDTAPGGSVVLLAEEQFTGGAIPAGWAASSGTTLTTAGWTDGNTAAGTADAPVVHHTTQGNAGTNNRVVVSNGPTQADYLIVNGSEDGGDVKDEILTMPNVTGITGPGVLFLEFDSEVRTSADAFETIEVSFDGGSTWETSPVFEYTKQDGWVDGQEPAVTKHYVPVNITSQTQAQFRFRYQTAVNDAGTAWWSIDNVRVTFEGGAVAPVRPATGGVGAQVPLDVATSGVSGRTTVFGNYGLNHIRTEVQAIATGGDFATPLATTTVDSGDLTQFTLTGLNTLNETYFIRSRHVATSIDGSATEIFSDWSPTISFQVVAPPNPPSFNAPPASFDAIAAFSSGVTFDLDPFSSPDAGATHTRTTWELVEQGETFDVPVLSGFVETGDLTTFTIPNLAIPDQDFTVRVRYESGALVSDWTELDFSVDRPAGTDLLFAEDFSGATLNPAVDESIGFLGWTDQFPQGWVRFDDNTGDGAVEWDGWVLTNNDFHVAADNQNRDRFTLSRLGDDIYAVADGDEYDDVRGGGDMDATLRTPSIGVDTGDVHVFYIYSYRFEAPGVAETFSRFGNPSNPANSLFRLDSNNPNDFVNNTNYHLLSATEPSLLFLEWRYYGEDPAIDFRSPNDWWFAIDRVQVYGTELLQTSTTDNWNLYQ